MSSEQTQPVAGGRWYRTFVRGRLVQQSALVAGGSDPKPGEADITCARDGAGRLVIPGTGVAGALIETAGRICSQLLRSAPESRDLHLKRITCKGEEVPEAVGEQQMLQSLVRVYPAHRVVAGKVERAGQKELGGSAESELRQGVGIRQATGATAAGRGALFDLEVVPSGTTWDFFLEIDTLRGGAKVERLILLAVAEWAAGRCWLGGSAARGTGWMTLDNIELLRLPLCEAAIDGWPNNTLASSDERWVHLNQVAGAETAKGGEALRRWADESNDPKLGDDQFWYLGSMRSCKPDGPPAATDWMVFQSEAMRPGC